MYSFNVDYKVTGNKINVLTESKKQLKKMIVLEDIESLGIKKGQTILIESKQELKEGKGYSKLIDQFNDKEIKDIQRVASKFNTDHEWGIWDAILLAYFVCEDANAHDICKVIEQQLEKSYMNM